MLEMHRTNGNKQNYTELESVVLLCSNCHSTTNDYRNRTPVVE
jgi:hypothetical protein